LLRSTAVGANLTTDAHIAAHAIERGGMLCSNDGDFSRFAGLRLQNPLAWTRGLALLNHEGRQVRVVRMRGIVDA